MKKLPDYVTSGIIKGNKYIAGHQNPLYNPMDAPLEFFEVEKSLDCFDDTVHTVRRMLNGRSQLFILNIERSRVTWNGTRALWNKLYG